ncbi:MAG: hypothetical protein GTN38_03170 [Candidatus Aenigmarchaeota archaeon]|nr:hypothetical protein [Candidatus Aenigmarchaeota archaeon]NIP40663.1 hypothetical protein [Candidatus Aenigmarchaeota archaeon]NIQ18469.1 hypothetical protein [Candidatus Aenigmarchaeota archaeon]NIS73368.1 hypothetical protein [Candidatus Aenigmarchaeota archaeon]
MGRKLVVYWIFGAILVMLSSWILGNIEQTTGTSPISYALAVFIAFVLVLAGGLAWITVASVVAKH